MLIMMIMKTMTVRDVRQKWPEAERSLVIEGEIVITRDGKPIIGGTDIDKWDYEFVALIYPKPKRAPTTARRKTSRRTTAGKPPTRRRRAGLRRR